MATDISTVIGVAITSVSTKTTLPAAPAGSTSRESTSTDIYTETASDNSSTYTYGAGPNLAKGHFHGTWSCAAGAQVVFDMNALAGMFDAFGDLITATEIKAIVLHNLSTTPGELLEVLGDAAAVGQPVMFTLVITDAVNLHPDGVLLLTSPIDGYAVGAGANDRIEVDNNQAGAISFEIFVLYEHA